MMIVAIIIIAIKKRLLTIIAKITVIKIVVGHQVMTEQTFRLTEHFLLEICRNDWSVNGTIWTSKCSKLHVFDLVEEMKRRKFVHWILSLQATKFYEAKVNSFCMCKLLIKINIVQTQFRENQFIIFFDVFKNMFCLECFFWGKGELVELVKTIHISHHSPLSKCSHKQIDLSYTLV